MLLGHFDLVQFNLNAKFWSEEIQKPSTLTLFYGYLNFFSGSEPFWLSFLSDEEINQVVEYYAWSTVAKG